MKTNTVLARVYRTSSMIILAVMLLICFLFHWKWQTTIVVMLASLVISAPAVVLLNAICWVLARVQMTIAFAWILLLAAVPVAVLLPALLLANAVPGDALFVTGLGMLGSYLSLLGYGNSIAELFKTL